MSETHVSSDEIFIVDDDPMVNDLLTMTFRSEGYRVTSFSDGERFNAVARLRVPACIILDVFMPGRSGLDILKEINAHNYAAPIIVMSGNASIPMAVEAVKNGAFDIIEKPFALETIVTRVREVIDAWMRRRATGNNSEILSAEFPGFERLTQRELEVLAEITAAASNREAGSHLGISPRTIEVHRGRIMMKLGAKNTADLVRIALTKRQH
jgi:two-component system response regulator FixJ